MADLKSPRIPQPELFCVCYAVKHGDWTIFASPLEFAPVTEVHKTRGNWG